MLIGSRLLTLTSRCMLNTTRLLHNEKVQAGEQHCSGINIVGPDNNVTNHVGFTYLVSQRTVLPGGEDDWANISSHISSNKQFSVYNEINSYFNCAKLS